MFGSVAYVLLKNMAAQLKFAKMHLKEPQYVKQHALNGHKQSADLLPEHNLKKTKCRLSTETTSSEHGGGWLMIWVCFAATGPENLAVIKSTMIMNFSVKYSRVCLTSIAFLNLIQPLHLCFKAM